MGSKIAPVGEGTWYTGYCYSTLAGMLWAEGDIKAAIALQQRAISAFQSIPSSLPNWREIQSELGMTHVRMANFLYHDGQHENASQSAQQGIAIIEPLFRQDPKSVNLRQHVMAAWDQSGYAWLASDPRRALRVYRDAEQAGADWLPAHPQALEILEGLAESRSGIARAAAVLGDVKLADEKSEEAVANADSLVGLDPGNAHYRFSLALAYQYRGEVMEKIKPAIAVQNYRKALGTVQPMADADRASYLKLRLVSDLRDRLKRVF